MVHKFMNTMFQCSLDILFFRERVEYTCYICFGEHAGMSLIFQRPHKSRAIFSKTALLRRSRAITAELCCCRSVPFQQEERHQRNLSPDGIANALLRKLMPPSKNTPLNMCVRALLASRVFARALPRRHASSSRPIHLPCPVKKPTVQQMSDKVTSDLITNVFSKLQGTLRIRG